MDYFWILSVFTAAENIEADNGWHGSMSGHTLSQWSGSMSGRQYGWHGSMSGHPMARSPLDRAILLDKYFNIFLALVVRFLYQLNVE